ncbi:MAG: hypothetical protein HUK24_01800, partial [Sphaerochaetaceae bacterium]|nr:hypothetical protein [Sphaerochaetaceae bacterium]
IDSINEKITVLESYVEGEKNLCGSERAHYCRNNIVPAMDSVRKLCDKAELIVDSKYWPYPSYGDILYYL